MPASRKPPPSTKAPARTGRRSRAILPGTTLAAFVMAVIAIVVIAGMSRQSSQSRTAGVQALNHTHAVQLQLSLVLSDLTDAETGQRGFLLTGLESYLEPYNTARTS